jgi:hypothetical protein
MESSTSRTETMTESKGVFSPFFIRVVGTGMSLLG